MVIENKSTHHFFESSYFNVAGTDTQADSMFLKEPPFTVDSICSKINIKVQKYHTPCEPIVFSQLRLGAIASHFSFLLKRPFGTFCRQCGNSSDYFQSHASNKMHKATSCPIFYFLESLRNLIILISCVILIWCPNCDATKLVHQVSHVACKRKIRLKEGDLIDTAGTAFSMLEKWCVLPDRIFCIWINEAIAVPWNIYNSKWDLTDSVPL